MSGQHTVVSPFNCMDAAASHTAMADKRTGQELINLIEVKVNVKCREDKTCVSSLPPLFLGKS